MCTAYISKLNNFGSGTAESKPIHSESDRIHDGQYEAWGRVLHSHSAILHGPRRFIRRTCFHRDHAQSSVISRLPLALDRGAVSESRGTESMCRMRLAVDILLFRLDRIVWSALTRDRQAGRRRRRTATVCQAIRSCIRFRFPGFLPVWLSRTRLPPAPIVS